LAAGGGATGEDEVESQAASARASAATNAHRPGGDGTPASTDGRGSPVGPRSIRERAAPGAVVRLRSTEPFTRDRCPGAHGPVKVPWSTAPVPSRALPAPLAPDGARVADESASR